MKDELLGAESVLLVQFGDVISIEREFDIEGKTIIEMSVPYELRPYHWRNFVSSVESGMKFKIIKRYKKKDD